MVQKLQDIKPADAHAGNAKPKDPVQAEYEDGKRYLEKNDLGQAAAALHNALLGYEERNELKGIANASNQLAQVCLKRKDYQQAEKHLLRVSEICREMKDAMSIVMVDKQLVEVYQGLGKFAAALDTCLDLFDWYTANNDPQGTVGILETMAEMYLESHEPLKAADAYRTIASIHRNYKHQNIAERYMAQAEALEKKVH